MGYEMFKTQDAPTYMPNDYSMSSRNQTPTIQEAMGQSIYEENIELTDEEADNPI